MFAGLYITPSHILTSYILLTLLDLDRLLSPSTMDLIMSHDSTLTEYLLSTITTHRLSLTARKMLGRDFKFLTHVRHDPHLGCVKEVQRALIKGLGDEDPLYIIVCREEGTGGLWREGAYKKMLETRDVVLQWVKEVGEGWEEWPGPLVRLDAKLGMVGMEEGISQKRRRQHPHAGNDFDVNGVGSGSGGEEPAAYRSIGIQTGITGHKILRPGSTGSNIHRGLSQLGIMQKDEQGMIGRKENGDYRMVETKEGGIPTEDSGVRGKGVERRRDEAGPSSGTILGIPDDPADPLTSTATHQPHISVPTITITRPLPSLAASSPAHDTSLPALPLLIEQPVQTESGGKEKRKRKDGGVWGVRKAKRMGREEGVVVKVEEGVDGGGGGGKEGEAGEEEEAGRRYNFRSKRKVGM